MWHTYMHIIDDGCIEFGTTENTVFELALRSMKKRRVERNECGNNTLHLPDDRVCETAIIVGLIYTQVTVS